MQRLAPFLILFATFLFALQGAVARWTGSADAANRTTHASADRTTDSAADNCATFGARGSSSPTANEAGSVSRMLDFTLLLVCSGLMIGLMYALIWESLIGNFAPGAKNLSIQQWSLAIAKSLTSATAVKADISLGAAVVLLIIVSALGALLATTRLRTLSVTSAD